MKLSLALFVLACASSILSQHTQVQGLCVFYLVVGFIGFVSALVFAPKIN